MNICMHELVTNENVKPEKQKKDESKEGKKE